MAIPPQLVPTVARRLWPYHPTCACSHQKTVAIPPNLCLQSPEDCGHTTQPVPAVTRRLAIPSNLCLQSPEDCGHTTQLVPTVARRLWPYHPTCACSHQKTVAIPSNLCLQSPERLTHLKNNDRFDRLID